MAVAKLKQLKHELKDLGFFNFAVMKGTEFFYKKKFKKLGVYYPDGQGTNEMVNKQSANKDSNRNQAIGYFYLKKGFDHTGLKYSDISLVDIGCGFGKVVNFGMFLNFKSVTGVDLDSSVIELANTNCARMKKNGYTTAFEVCQADASEYLIPEGINVIFMFNPFGRKTMQDVVKNIINYHHKRTDDLHIVYCTPVHKDVLTSYDKCVKIYEAFNANKTKSVLAVFKLSHKWPLLQTAI